MKPTSFNYSDYAKLQIEMERKNEYVNALIAENERLRKQLDAAVEDLYIACKGAPCNSGVCVAKNCKGNIIPCNFEWRGEVPQKEDTASDE